MNYINGLKKPNKLLNNSVNNKSVGFQSAKLNFKQMQTIKKII